MCQWPNAGEEAAALRLSPPVQDAFFQRPAMASTGQTIVLKPPTRQIKDQFPSFAGIVVDPMRNEVAVTDENLQQILFYSRIGNNTPNQIAKPVRAISAGQNTPEEKRNSKTNIEFQAGIYLDPANGDVYGVNNDSHDTMVVFSRSARGNVPPTRELHIPHGAFGVAVDEDRQELYLAVQHDSALAVFRKSAGGEDAPIRLIQGEQTRLANPHGIAFDARRGLLFVTNHGAYSARSPRDPSNPDPEFWPTGRVEAVAGSGRILPAAITVHEKAASGNARPVRVIEGPLTRLNWPAGIAVDSARGELYVANDAGESILVFDIDARGNVAPRRVLSGPRTGIKNPTAVALDLQNNELWVANFGNHTATAYPLGAQGDVAPVRTIRSAPAGTVSHMIGNPGGVAYDTRREEILVPN
jgi:DNA-binding beta-propeller fold protein YncE